MTCYTVCGYDLSDLLSPSISSTSLAKVPSKPTPSKNKESIIYSIWDEDDYFLYVGVSGPQKGDRLSRIKKHASGSRSGSQFCVYVQDYFIVPWLGANYKRAKGKLNRLTKCYIHTYLSYRLKIIPNDSRRKTAECLEKYIIGSGVYGKKPLLNGKGEW